ncbi:MAG TPA: hypothetical protein VJV79_17670 [Polyangiaceae bacterium]|nr:hypothetical protein [Polyangiaceae bacterium]
MTHFALQRFVHLCLSVTLAACALGCGADRDHAPPIGSPPGAPGPIIVEDGGPRGSGGAGASTNTNTGGSVIANGGAFNTAPFGTSGNGNGSAGRDSIGAGGTSFGGPFGIGGLGIPSSAGSF